MGARHPAAWGECRRLRGTSSSALAAARRGPAGCCGAHGVLPQTAMAIHPPTAYRVA